MYEFTCFAKVIFLSFKVPGNPQFVTVLNVFQVCNNVILRNLRHPFYFSPSKKFSRFYRASLKTDVFSMALHYGYINVFSL